MKSLLPVFHLTILALLAGTADGQTKCNAYGTSATYSETIGTSSSIASRTISSNGCPNHYSLCTGKGVVSGCGDVGETGTDTEAKEQTKSIVIPASPVLRASISLTDTANGGIKCQMGAIGIALNGVSIYGGAVDTQCSGILVDDTSSEWTGFDCCSGHSERTGDYHYHFPPSCLLKQIGDLSDGHSPQVKALLVVSLSTTHFSPLMCAGRLGVRWFSHIWAKGPSWSNHEVLSCRMHRSWYNMH